MIGHIKLHRKLFQWEWYEDVNVRIVFLHFLLKANWKNGSFKGIDINRGQLIIGHKQTPQEIGVTIQQFRTAIKKLKSTSEITTKSTNKFTVITLVNYDNYQGLETPITSKLTSNLTNGQHSNNIQITTSKEDKKIRRKEEKNINIDFDVFWNLYNKKVGSKLKAKSKWLKLKDLDRTKIISTLPMFIKSIKDKQYQPHPITYLSNERWNDELKTTKIRKPYKPTF